MTAGSTPEKRHPASDVVVQPPEPMLLGTVAGPRGSGAQLPLGPPNGPSLRQLPRRLRDWHPEPRAATRCVLCSRPASVEASSPLLIPFAVRLGGEFPAIVRRFLRRLADFVILLPGCSLGALAPGLLERSQDLAMDRRALVGRRAQGHLVRGRQRAVSHHRRFAGQPSTGTSRAEACERIGKLDCFPRAAVFSGVRLLYFAIGSIGFLAPTPVFGALEPRSVIALRAAILSSRIASTAKYKSLTPLA